MPEHDLLPRARRKRRHALLKQLRELDRPPLTRELQRLQRALRGQLVSRPELVVRPVARRPPLRTGAAPPVVDVAGALLVRLRHAGPPPRLATARATRVPPQRPSPVSRQDCHAPNAPNRTLSVDGAAGL